MKKTIWTICTFLAGTILVSCIKNNNARNQESAVEDTFEMSTIDFEDSNTDSREVSNDNTEITEVASNANVIEGKAEFPGGEVAMNKFIKDNLKRPSGNDAQGRVVVCFGIDANGNIVNPTITRGIDETCDKEALRLVNSMPKWIPGTNKGTYTVVVKF